MPWTLTVWAPWSPRSWWIKGELEYGSPKKPALMEAAALNMADNTDAKMETFTELFDNAKDPNEWLGYNRLFESNIRKTSM